MSISPMNFQSPSVGQIQPISLLTPIKFNQPTLQPLSRPTLQPLSQHTLQPLSQSLQPLSQHTLQPLSQPTLQPISQHTLQPISQHTLQPISQHTLQPLQSISQSTLQPISQHTLQPLQSISQPLSQPLQPLSQHTLQPLQSISQSTHQPLSQSLQPISIKDTNELTSTTIQLSGTVEDEKRSPLMPLSEVSEPVMSPTTPKQETGEIWKTFYKDDLFLLEDHPQTPYRRRQFENKTSVHWGQRKLALTTLAFINFYWDPTQMSDPIIVYAGSCPGININFIISLYPQIEWHLYDPHMVGFKVKSNPKVHIYREYFTDLIAESWSGKQILFISDIRTMDSTKTKNKVEIEKGIWADMKIQEKWVKIIKPVAAMLKFRLPYGDIKFSDEIDNEKGLAPYLAGVVLKQPWASQTGTETRLLITASSMIDGEFPIHQWNIKNYEDKLFHHNAIIREWVSFYNPFYHQDPIKRKTQLFPPELDNSWDSMVEVKIFMDYLTKHNITDNILPTIHGLSNMLTVSLSEGESNSSTLDYRRKNPQAFKRHQSRE